MFRPEFDIGVSESSSGSALAKNNSLCNINVGLFVSSHGRLRP